MIKKLKNIPGAAKKAFKKFKSYSLKKKIVLSILFVIILIVAINVITRITKKPDYTLAKVERTNITETITETGDIVIGGKINVYSPTNGVVEEVYVKNGDATEEGASLAKIKSSATFQEQQSALATYLTAKNALDAANSDLSSLQATMFDKWDTFRLLAKSGNFENSDGSPRNEQRALPEFHIAEKEWLAAEADYKNQQAVISKTQAQVASTWLLYEATQDTVVKAQSSGTISNLSVTAGSNVSINSVTAPATPLLVIGNGKDAEIVVSLSESDISNVEEGQSADIKVASLEKTYKGTVKRVDSIGNSLTGVIRYNVYIGLPKTEDNLKSGMTADTTITTKSLENVLSVPNSAVKPYQGGRAVRLLKNGKIEYKPVKIGIKGTSRTQIFEGLSEGQEIITVLSNEQIKRPGLF